jgi:IMP dehydrogenase
MSADTFNEVLFKPQKSEIPSRTLCDTSWDFGKFKLKIPIISSNMKDITEEKMAFSLAKHGALGILHRFGSVQDSIDNVDKTKALFEEENVELSPYSFGVSVGVKEEGKERFDALLNTGMKLFTIDVAHGHHILVEEMVKYMRDKSGSDIYIIAGNVATPEGAIDLTDWGADCIKVGIGPGARCVTRKNTGVGVPQLRAIREIRNTMPNIHIISDGGIKYGGDIPKALKYADAVMVGSYLAGTAETPGHVYQNDDGEFYKVYGGSASGERKTADGKNNKFVEGVVATVKFRGRVKHILNQTEEWIQSSMSYSGAWNMKEFKEKSILEQISSGGQKESRF